MAVPTPGQIKAQVARDLEGTPYAAATLTALSGGTANFMYCAHLAKPLHDGTEQVLVKHGRDFLASGPDFKLPTSRCVVEDKCLKALGSFTATPVGDAGNNAFRVRTPKYLPFDQAETTQIQEYLPDSLSLKEYVLKHCSSPTPASLEPRFRQLGTALGRWLREFHDWATDQTSLRHNVAANKEMQQMKHMINFQWLLDRVGQFPTVLGGAESLFHEVKDAALAELGGAEALQVVHGDFWTGNVLLPDAPLPDDGVEVPVFVVDWEMAQLGVRSLDVGQMLAELYELWLYKHLEAGLWIAQGLAEGYGPVSEAGAFRTAVQMGAHLVCFGTSVPGWGTPAQVEATARTGRALIANAWQKNRAWFDGGELAFLFARAESCAPRTDTAPGQGHGP